ncbi:hypothetical protein DM02DRAFT_526553 [Periconia macrospinosa]|uniref:Integral membrane protein-like protein n=1 Tax=Periconia macrospinosa TaxID=97972 RepID=A0A2V1DRV4_9PLEO|nr:hypothetical protein DM02DRAFT_526553 [Periconia macrospinosa]
MSTAHETNEVKEPSHTAIATKTKRRFRGCRLGALVILLIGVVACVLEFAVLLGGTGGNQGGMWMDEWVLKVNTSRVGQDIIRFERASSSSSSPTSSASPTRTTAPSNPLDPLNPFSTASPLNPDNMFNGLTGSIQPILGNLTDMVNEGMGDVINGMTQGIIDQTGIKDFYYLYADSICKGDVANGSSAAKKNSDGVAIEKCESWSAATDHLIPTIQSSLVVGTTNISVPILAQLAKGAGGVSAMLSNLQTAIFAFLIISLATILLGILFALPSIVFSASRLLVYINVAVWNLACISSFVAAILLTILAVVVPLAVGDLLGAVGIVMSSGTQAMVFLWVVWVCCLLVGVYWIAVWFVEVRLSGFCKRRRTEAEVGNWRGIMREVWRDWKGVRDV